MGERTFDDFDEFATGYRELHTQNIKLSGADSFYFAEHKILLLKNTEKNDGARMLDIGCGDGATELFVHQNFPSWFVEGIDISSESIIQANKRNLINSQFSLYNGMRIPFETNSFDIVFMAAVLHHIEHTLHPVILKEIYRVLKPGGRLYVFEHNPINPVTRYLVNTCVFDKDAQLLSFWYTDRILKTASFKSLRKKFILFFPRKGLLSRLVKIEKFLGWFPLGAQYYFRCVK